MTAQELLRKANQKIDEATALQNEGRHDEAFELLDEAEELTDNAEGLNLTPDPEPQRSIEKLRAMGALGQDITPEFIAATWEGIPIAFWPTADKPWRITWGFNLHADFATEDEAEKEASKLRDARNVGVTDPFNIHDRTFEMAQKKEARV